MYEVEYADGRYTVTSQAIPITDADAVPLLRVVAFVLPQSEADDALLRAVKTGRRDPRSAGSCRNSAQDDRAVVPGVVVRGSEGST